MLKKFLLFCSVVLVWGGLSAQPHIQQIQDAAGVDFVQHSVAEFSSNHYVVAGTVTPGPLSGQSDILVMLVRIDGTIVWARYVDYGQDEFVGSVMVGASQEVMLTGYTGANNTPNKRLIVVRLNSGGNPAGDMVIEDPGGFGYGLYGFDLEQADNGDYIIVGTGVQMPTATASKYAFVMQVNGALNSIVWSRIYQSGGSTTEYDSFNHILKVPDYPYPPPASPGEAYLLTGSGKDNDPLPQHQMAVSDLINPNDPIFPGSSAWGLSTGYNDEYYNYSGKLALYDVNNDEFYIQHTGFRTQPSIAHLDVGGSLIPSLSPTTSLSYGMVGGNSNLISGMDWSNPGNTEITFSGYNIGGSIGRPMQLSVDVSSGTPAMLWSYLYDPPLNAAALQSIPLDYMTAPLEAFPTGYLNQHYYQPKALVRDSPGYNFAAPFDNGSFFSLDFTNTNSGGIVDLSCMQDGGHGINNNQIKYYPNFQSFAYSFALTNPQPPVTVTPTNPTGALFCVLSPSPSPSPATGAKPQNGLPDEVNLSLYPNPVAEQLYLQGFSDTMENATISLYDMTGRRVLQQQQQKGNTEEQLNVASLPSGVYFVKVHTTKGALIFQERIVKE